MENAGMDEPLTADPVDIGLVAKKWWRDNSGRRLPGEASGYTVFVVQFLDGCVFVEYTQGTAFERVSELAFSPVEIWQDRFVASHAVAMAYLVRCVASELTRGEAAELASRLMVTAPQGMELRGRRVLEHAECFLGVNAPEPVSMSFGEWIQTRETVETGGSPS